MEFLKELKEEEEFKTLDKVYKAKINPIMLKFKICLELWWLTLTLHKLNN